MKLLKPYLTCAFILIFAVSIVSCDNADSSLGEWDENGDSFLDEDEFG